MVGEKIYQNFWIELDKQTRIQLAKDLGLKATGIVEIRDQSVVSDGFTNTDLSVITAERLAQYVGQEVGDTSFHRLWELTLSKVKGELNPMMNLNGNIGPVTTNPSAKLTIERTKPETNLERLLEAPKEVVKEEKPEKKQPPACDSCDTKGYIHKKDCPKFISPNKNKNENTKEN